MFTESFMIRAVLAALFLAPLCGCLGVFVTARRMAFFSDTISHAGLAGIALGFWWGMPEPTLPLVGFSLLVAGALLFLKENTELVTDTLMALLLSGSVAFGILLMSLRKGYRGELHRYLFGDILAVSWPEVVVCGVLLVLVSAWLFSQLSAMTLITAHEEMAHVCGLRVRLLNYIFVIVLTLVVSMSIRLLGIILVTSLLVIPAATARNISKNLRQQLVLSMGVGLVAGLVGTVAAYQWDVPCGPTIVLTSIVLFVISLANFLLKRTTASAMHRAQI